MRALVLRPGTTEVCLVERPMPEMTSDGDVLIRMLEVGICGTDREQAAGLLGRGPVGSPFLIPGHEMLGEVAATGPEVRRVRKGDLVTLTVRRGCRGCAACSAGRPDLCETGCYSDRGVIGMDGFQTEYVVDHESTVVRVPRRLRSVGVLCEPLSVVEKGFDVARRLQRARLPWVKGGNQWLSGRNCLVIGAGPVGLLASMVGLLRGARVTTVDLLNQSHPRARYVVTLGGRYICGWHELEGAGDHFDLIVEAAGATRDFPRLVPLLARNGILVYIGNACRQKEGRVDLQPALRHLVVGNGVIVGVVNAGARHYRMALRDLGSAVQRWGVAVVRGLITHRVPPELAPGLLKRPLEGEIKAVVSWAGD